MRVMQIDVYRATLTRWLKKTMKKTVKDILKKYKNDDCLVYDRS
jgi:hypothetical protein